MVDDSQWATIEVNFEVSQVLVDLRAGAKIIFLPTRMVCKYLKERTCPELPQSDSMDRQLKQLDEFH